MVRDICNSVSEANFAVKYHRTKKHKKIKKTKAGDSSIVVSNVTGTPPNYVRKGVLYETGPEVWVVTAED